MTKLKLGIMTLYWKDREERNYFRKLIEKGTELGMDCFVFTPVDVNGRSRKVFAYCYQSADKTWTRKWMPFPDVVYDRCRYEASARFRSFRQFRAKHSRLIYMNRPLANKWLVHQELSKVSSLRNHIPTTKVYGTATDLLQYLKKFDLLYLKPINGTGGRGILRVEKQSNGQYRIQGRDHNRRMIPPRMASAAHIASRLRKWNLSGTYLIQQGLDLKLDNGRVHDYRLLIQKDGTGKWNITGCAGRIGPLGSVTSNLHGGGKAVPMLDILNRRFHTSGQAETIRKNVYQLSYHIAEALEKKYGQLCEIGMDIGIDGKGEIWLIEINPKPAREVFSKIGDKTAYDKAVKRPLEYAMWLYKSRGGNEKVKKAYN